MKLRPPSSLSLSPFRYLAAIDGAERVHEEMWRDEYAASNTFESERGRAARPAARGRGGAARRAQAREPFGRLGRFFGLERDGAEAGADDDDEDDGDVAALKLPDPKDRAAFDAFCEPVIAQECLNVLARMRELDAASERPGARADELDAAVRVPSLREHGERTPRAEAEARRRRGSAAARGRAPVRARVRAQVGPRRPRAPQPPPAPQVLRLGRGGSAASCAARTRSAAA